MASKYMQRKFKDEFSEIMEMWTGEDGMLMSLTILRTPNAAEILKEHSAFHHLESFKPERMKEKFVFRDWLEDTEDWSDIRKVWRVTDKETDFPVYEYELEFPR